jgi:CPA1 family monovalent cation:H+ antiporter
MLTTVGSIILIGMFVQWLAWKQKIPSIISLLVSGSLVGPVFGILNPGEVMGQDVIFSIVEISFALILFDGAMQLKFSEFKPVSSGLKRILTLGVVIHFVLITAGAHLIMKFYQYGRVFKDSI